MMTLRGHTVIHYGHEDSDVECTEHVTVLSREDYNRVYGEHDFRSKLFKFDQSDDAYNTFNANAIREINARKQPGDFLLAFWGSGHQTICNGAGEGMRVVEPGIGYPHGHFAEYKIFESYAIYHAFMKTDRVAHCVGVDTWSKEAVIPNYFDISDFVDTVVPAKERGDYFLFVGRIGSAKGVDHAIRMTGQLGVRLLVAGQNAEDGLKEVGMYPPPKHVEIIGHVDVEKRKVLMANAKAVVCMSTFAEPFCGVHVEAMMSGTPIITADWGAFTEFNIHGVTGFRCRTLEQMVEAGRRIHEIDPMVCRKWAFDNFSTDRVADMYEAFFEGNMTPLLVSTKKKVAVWCETKWALGRIGNAIKKYIPNVDMYDWGKPSDNTAFWNEEKWKDYDAIISNTTLHSLDKLYGFHPTEEMLKRFVVIAHFPRFEGMSYFQETLEKHRKESRYAGVSRETCEEMKKYGVENPIYVPFGADTDVFPWTHKVNGPIRRLGIIGGTTRTKEWAAHDEYVKNKGLLMFSDICNRGGYEPVYIHGKTSNLYGDIDALICCSEIEGGPLGIFEAASCGVPVLTRAVGNVQYVKGIKMFDTADDALNILDAWNKDIGDLKAYTKTVTSEIRINWSMRTLLKKHLVPLLNQESTYDTLKPEIDVHISCLKQIIEASGEPCEGNVFWFQHKHHEQSLFLNKRLNLFNYSKKAQEIMEIGFNAGHSTLLYLMSNPTSKIQLFDLGEHRYTRACFEYLSIQFPGRLTITYGDSRQTVPAYVAENVGKVFDMIHIDGGHDQSVVRSDILNSIMLSNEKTIIISDDDNLTQINRMNRQYLQPVQDALPSEYHYVGKIR